MKNRKIKISLFISYFVFAILLNSVGILIQRSVNQYGTDELSAGSLEGFKDLSIAFASFLAGSFLPRLGYKKAMLLALALVLSGCLIMYYGNSFNAVKILFTLLGISFAFIKTSVYSLTGLLTTGEKEHTGFLSAIESVFMIGIATAFIGFPLFYSDTDPDAWLNIYPAIALLVAFSFIFLFTSDFSALTHEYPATNPLHDLKQMFYLLKRPAVPVFALAALMYVMAEQGIMSWLPTFNERVLHLPEALAVRMSVILILSIAAGRYVSALLVKKMSWLLLLLICLAAAGLMVITVLPHAANPGAEEIKTLSDVPLIAWVFPLIGFFLAPVYPMVSSAVLSSTEKIFHSPMASLLVFFSALGGTAGSRLAGWLFHTIGGSKAFYFSLIPLTALVICLLMLQLIISRKKV